MVNLKGRRFERLVVQAFVGRVGKALIWTVHCDCGNTLKVRAGNLTSRNTRSCGCLHLDTVRTHGLYQHPLHRVWLTMLDRCRNPKNKQYVNYGARGIKVCRRWHKFENFFADVSPTYVPGLTLDRLNNAQGYRPKNCAWRTRSEQARNTRRNRFVDTPKGRMLLCKAVEVSGIARHVLLKRTILRWSAADLFKPVQRS